MECIIAIVCLCAVFVCVCVVASVCVCKRLWEVCFSSNQTQTVALVLIHTADEMNWVKQ